MISIITRGIWIFNEIINRFTIWRKFQFFELRNAASYIRKGSLFYDPQFFNFKFTRIFHFPLFYLSKFIFKKFIDLSIFLINLITSKQFQPSWLLFFFNYFKLKLLHVFNLQVSKNSFNCGVFSSHLIIGVSLSPYWSDLCNIHRLFPQA